MDTEKGRGQKAEGRGQRAEGRRQRAEGRKQKAEGRGQRAESRSEECTNTISSGHQAENKPSALCPLTSAFLIDDSHLKGNIFSNVNASTNQGQNLSRSSPGYQQSKAEVQQQIKTMRKRLHPKNS
ncbi:hypothetical protein VF04_03780 [Nostoc linckia z7]|uniref:Uncharacterized protein n=2 Tax=Nostoc linckia TaxID=92942 RepID=A0A9Q5ZGB1_NOSLI|nr:hypothetical protein VF02_11270 [Nostoc linckia z1]PHJ70095.1 hypothetical protein VF05_11425 [Nostoc linckia z3]PHJ74996.1 hypothetical protein VF03_11585 [Nostoc linckia z2]PHJ83021.1 hypothetical protein VF06_14850 [Nostoc linckia z4]PHJ89118.1 hypothetical protein VF07_14045 [Nostoc linckia z6]PHK00040.1 hypothetical protein VF04_03780 [Nostoc linckia z7]PHK06703.1 hypothetical protein VF08_02910 [Nostoc linckia z8]PHK23158.1 hypothetical protein VF11_02255 [Nostoc linckia z14]PHK268